MIRELLDVGGRPLLIPVMLAAAGMYLINWLLSLERRRSDRRREFLELWPKRVADDDLWAQVALRHLTGEYLPQSIVTMALSLPDKAAALLDLASIWDYLRLTPGQPAQLEWKRKAYANAAVRTWATRGFNFGYFLFAGAAGVLLMNTMRGALVASTWVWGINAALFGMLAFLCLASAHQLKQASALAPRYIAKFNVHLVGETQPPAPSLPPLPSGLP